jgi:hypothetical protein
MKRIIKIRNYIDKVTPIPLKAIFGFIVIILLFLAFYSKQEALSYSLRFGSIIINSVTIIYLRDLLRPEESANHKELGYLKIKAISSSIIFIILNLSLGLIENWIVVLILFLFSIYMLSIIYISIKFF